MSYLVILLLVGLLITLHELGHFMVAKACRIPIARFSVGFGPRVLGFAWRGTSYWVSAIPLGGYVLPELDEDEFRIVSIKRRIAFALGGPAANVAGAFVGLICLNLWAAEMQFLEACGASFNQLVGMTLQLLNAIPGIFGGTQPISGVVGIVAAGGAQFGATVSGLLAFSVILNLNLAVLNLLPIPPLDGARILFCVVERVCPRWLRLQRPAMIAGWCLVFGVMIYATVQDIGRIVVGAGA